MNEASRARLGALLSQAFETPASEGLPTAFLELLARLEATDAAEGVAAALPDPEFKAQLAAVLPQLRAFARSLARDSDLADDLVQETMLKAWRARDRFQAGTNMRAWTYTILRNLFVSGTRRARFHGEWDDRVADRVLAQAPTQDGRLELADLRRALDELPRPQREALMLVGAGGFAYEEVASITGVPVGTVKSRVARARVAIEAMVDGGKPRPGPRTPIDGARASVAGMLAEAHALAGA